MLADILINTAVSVTLTSLWVVALTVLIRRRGGVL